MSGDLPRRLESGSGSTDIDSRVARVEAELRRLRLILALVTTLAIVGVAWSMIRPARVNRNPEFDTVRARQFLVEEGGTTRATFGMSERPPAAVLLLGPDDRRSAGISMGSMGQLNVRGAEGMGTTISGPSLFMQFGGDESPDIAFGRLSPETSYWQLSPENGHARFFNHEFPARYGDTRKDARAPRP